MQSRFELFVAGRYLRAKRKRAALSLITGISILGVAAGVMALIIALAINSGFRNTLQRNLLGATAHVSVLEKTPGYGIENWRDLSRRFAGVAGVRGVYASLYGQIFLGGARNSTGAILKGVDLSDPVATEDIRRHLRQGSLERAVKPNDFPGLVIGARLAESTGLQLGQVVNVISPTGEMTPLGPRPSYHEFRVVGIYESGFYELDNVWIFSNLKSVQRMMGLGDVVNSVEMKISDIYQAQAVAREVERLAGPQLAATTWMEQNRQLLSALRMERIVTVITIGLIQLVAALNIFITLVMMVMEKQKDVAILVSMGARREQIRNIFVAQGVLIGMVGTALGLAAGYTLSFLADKHRWVQLDEQVYSLAFVPFEPRVFDGVWVSAAAIFVSFIATLYPARSAARVVPVEALRYE
ncbi:MAG TPA: ABC transporter permease [Solibacterales bacterium]|nr:ABC transporter permease [Bryobacterales bacterium]